MNRFLLALSIAEDEYSDYDGHIDWENGTDYCASFCDTLHSYLKPLIRQKKNEAAFHCLDAAFYVLNSVDLDGSFGELETIGRKIKTYWKQVIQNSSIDEQEEMRVWFETMERQTSEYISTDVITDIQNECFG